MPQNCTVLSLIWLLVSPMILCAEKPSPEARFTVPTQGHMEVLMVPIDRVHHLQIETLEDVLELREKLQKVPLDRKAILDKTWLPKAGITTSEAPLPAPPPRAVGKVRRFDWWQTTVDFNETHFVERRQFEELRRLKAISPACSIEQQSHPTRDYFDHLVAGSNWSARLTVDHLLMRGRNAFARPYGSVIVDQDEVLRIHTGEVETCFKTQGEDDAIEAVARLSNGKVRDFSLHLGLQPPSESVSFWLPQVVLRFRTADRDQHRATVYYIDRADFQTEVDPLQFQVPMKKGSVYIPRDEARPNALSVPVDIEDLSIFTPEQAKQLLQTIQRGR
ncbi:hypothetical protein [Bremerella cremea]|uniref:hypothetical protein n=1 Tax=Bremerella cremea TaxID=1031537 RepID=UPI0031EC4680